MNAIERFPLGNQAERPYSEEELKALVGKQIEIKEQSQTLIQMMERDLFKGGKFAAMNAAIEREKEKVVAADKEIARIKEVQKTRLSLQQSEKVRKAA